jgi:hypothetical protein
MHEESASIRDARDDEPVVVAELLRDPASLLIDGPR